MQLSTLKKHDKRSLIIPFPNETPASKSQVYVLSHLAKCTERETHTERQIAKKRANAAVPEGHFHKCTIRNYEYLNMIMPHLLQSLSSSAGIITCYRSNAISKTPHANKDLYILNNSE